MGENDFNQRVGAMRSFNRFYTKQIGVLHEHLLKSPFSLTEARVIYELAQCDKTTATTIRKELGLDAGYLSRVLSKFKKRGLIEKKQSKIDGRQIMVWLTEQGRDAFTILNASSEKEIGAILRMLSVEDQKKLVKMMNTIESLLGIPKERKVPYIIRPPQPGDMGWVVHRHGVLYSEEYSWDEQFEALVASIVADFIQDYDPKKERCWIAEIDGEIVGSVFIVKHSETVAKLRLLLVEPKARGMGIGTRLVNECVRFSKRTGYQKLTLWTNSVLHAARSIYDKLGFSLVHEEPHHSFGHDLVAETLELML